MEAELISAIAKPGTHRLPEDWQLTKLDDVAKRGTGHTPDKEKSEYYDGGIKWVSLADSNKLDNLYISETTIKISPEGIRKSSAVLHPVGTVVLSRDAGVGKSAIIAEVMAVSQHFVTWTCGDQINAVFLYYKLQELKPLFERMAVGSTIKTIGLPFFKKLSIPLPPLSQQRKIAAILSTWDEAIQTADQLVKAKKERKRGLMQQLLTGQKRLPGFSGEWLEVKLEEVSKEISTKNRHDKSLPVLSCTKHAGLVDSLEYFGRKIYSDDLSTYRIVPSGCFAYATNHIEEGSIGYQSKYDEALISPMYTVFKTNDSVHDQFMYAVLKTDKYIQIYKRNMSGSIDRRGGLRWGDFSKIKVPLPPLDEQRAITEVLKASNDEVRLATAEMEALKQQKRGLMQQLLTGQTLVMVDE